MTRMAVEGAAMVLASLDVKALKGGEYAVLMVTYERSELRAETEKDILSIVDEYLIFIGHFVEYSGFNLILPSVPFARALLSRVQRLDGVKKARIDFVEERFEMYDLLGAQVKRKVSEMRTFSPSKSLGQGELENIERASIASNLS
jgi:hypothetical protein